MFNSSGKQGHERQSEQWRGFDQHLMALTRRERIKQKVIGVHGLALTSTISVAVNKTVTIIAAQE